MSSPSMGTGGNGGGGVGFAGFKFKRPSISGGVGVNHEPGVVGVTSGESRSSGDVGHEGGSNGVNGGTSAEGSSTLGSWWKRKG
ncbi:hypothetical protein HDU98_012008 [Podochytrium sp. JEL0797]|nr:hypothetical protein HDU98_012008 [Podochytrium sp. JEL0797]